MIFWISVQSYIRDKFMYPTICHHGKFANSLRRGITSRWNYRGLDLPMWRCGKHRPIPFGHSVRWKSHRVDISFREIRTIKSDLAFHHRQIRLSGEMEHLTMRSHVVTMHEKAIKNNSVCLYC